MKLKDLLEIPALNLEVDIFIQWAGGYEKVYRYIRMPNRIREEQLFVYQLKDMLGFEVLMYSADFEGRVLLFVANEFGKKDSGEVK